MSLHVEPFYDPVTGTFSYVLVDTATDQCAVIDPVLDYDAAAGRVTSQGADRLVTYIKANDLDNQWLLETHIHADHISAAHYLQPLIGGQTGISSGFKRVLPHWVPLFDTGVDTPMDGSQFDHLWADGAEFTIGQLTVQVIHTPGHTPACVSYLVEDAVFVGDTLFHPELGTARVDFSGGDANDLYDSIQRLYQLPDETRVYLCHDYPENRPATCCVSLQAQKNDNTLLNARTNRAEFIAQRAARDCNLSVPELILPSIQSNMRLGDLGQADNNGVQYIRIPINQL